MIRNPVTIEPLSEDNIQALSTLGVKPFQKIFAGAAIGDLGQLEESVSVHAILKIDRVVGMFSVDKGLHRRFTFASFDTIGIQNFIVDQDYQGQGFGTEACRMMPIYLRGLAPNARGAYQLIHVNNAGGYKASSRGGWIDTGETYTIGPTGSQSIFWMPLR